MPKRRCSGKFMAGHTAKQMPATHLLLRERACSVALQIPVNDKDPLAAVRGVGDLPYARRALYLLRASAPRCKDDEHLETVADLRHRQ